MNRDTLVVLKSDFTDLTFPGTRFYCWHCALMEGVLAIFHELETQIDVLRVDWLRPRHEVIGLIGAENQSLPVLVFADEAGEGLPTQIGTPPGFCGCPARYHYVLRQLHVREG